MTAHSPPQPGLSNFAVRLITAAVAGPIVLLVTIWGGLPFWAAGLIFAALALMEFYAMGVARGVQGAYVIGLPAVIGLIIALVSRQYAAALLIVGLAAVATLVLEGIRRAGDGLIAQRLLITLLGLLYAGLPVAFLLELRALPDGLLWILTVFAITWGTDTLAYFGGRWWGKRPLAPRISPKKTVEGALVGLVGGALIGALALALGGQLRPDLLPLLLIGPPLAVLGDLFESWMKRSFGVKDSHVAGINIIPGHGGVLDRTDALIWVITLFWLWLV
ncbi:MAG: phosphatidate cytidylyltransferase [Anaerolineae bacterium]|nr:phosphatidate cytidylyltransferase [Anaerolineae bacterium]